MKNWFKIFFLFFILGFLLFSNSLHNKFLIDDYVYLNDPALSETKFILSQWNPYRERSLGVMLDQGKIGGYRPLQNMVLDYCYVTFKNDLWKYHLLNLFLFVFASSLIYLFIRKITGNDHLAFLTGLFYLIHPINGIVVNYISASVFAFQVICMLATVLFLLEALERNNDRVYYSLSLFLSALSLFWHETGVMTSIYVCAVVLIFRKDTLKEKASYLFPYFLIVFCYIVFRDALLGSNGKILHQMPFFYMTVGQYLAGLFQVYAWYISKLFYPQGIVMQWATPVLHDHIFLNVLGFFSLFMVFVLLFKRFSKEEICQLGLVWFMIGLLPVCYAAFRMPDNGVQIEPHWFVFSSIGFFVMAAYFFLYILDRMKRTGFLILFILIFILSTVSYAYNQLWADQKTYALYWSQQVPSLKPASFYLAYGYEVEGDLKNSRKYFSSLLKDQSSYLIYENLGVIDEKEGHFKDAELNIKNALSLNPFSSRDYAYLAFVYFEEGQWKKAKEGFERSLMEDPLLMEPRIGLASIYLKDKEYQKAVDLCLKNLDIVTDDPKTLLLLINIFIKEKDPVSLQKYVHRYINSNSDPASLIKVGIHLAQVNASALALDCFTQVIQIVPGQKDAYLAAGTVFANLGKFDEAIQIWKIGSGIDPYDQRFKKNIAQARVLRSK